MPHNTHRALFSLIIRLQLTIVIISLSQVASSAQATETAARPDRGVPPANAYAISDIENINLTNGNLNLSIPLAALPPVAGGKLSWVVRAAYNSKSWDRTSAEEAADLHHSKNYTTNFIQQGDVSGWRVGGLYYIDELLFEEDFTPLVPGCQGSLDCLEKSYRYKMILVTPDGTKHELRPLDHQGYAGTNDSRLGYYNITPRTSNTTMRYYSFDGSYLWATIDPDAAGLASWSVYFPDGTRVSQSNGVQRITDTNGNSIKIFQETDPQTGISTTHYQDEQTINPGPVREIRKIDDPSGDTTQIQYQTVGGEWVTIDINYGTTTIRGLTYNRGDRDCQHVASIVDEEQIRVIRSIVLPQTEQGQPRKQFTFSYNSDTTDEVNVTWWFACTQSQVITSASHGWGSLSRMALPSGATVDYSYSLDGQPNGANVWNGSAEIQREFVTLKVVTHDGVSDTWDYDVTPTAASVTGPDGSLVTEQFYHHEPARARAAGGGGDGRGGLVYRTTRPGGVVIERHWTLLQFTGAYNGAPGGAVVFNPVVDKEYTTLTENGVAVKMAAKYFQYDYNGALLQTTEYDWFDPAGVARDGDGVPTNVPASATVLRTISNSYYNEAPGAASPNVYAKRSLATASPLILKSPREIVVGNSRTRYSYDGLAFGTAPTAGNVTQISRLDDKGDAVSANDTWVSSSTTYGAYGNPATTTDANGNVTSLLYEDATHALPTTVTVNPLNGTGAQTSVTAYDYSTGLVTQVTDVNGQVSSVDYTNQLLGAADPFGRPGVTTGPAVTVDGISQRRKAFTFYEDSHRRVRSESDLNAEGDRLLKSRTTMDQLGRPVLSEQSENGSTYAVSAQTVYLQAGRVVMKSLPTRGDADAPDGWTRVRHDEAGRVVEVSTFAGTTQPPPHGTGANWKGSVTTAYDANAATVTDQNNKKRRSVVDALGRLTQVVEAPEVPTCQTTGAGCATHYTYDALSNLRKVDQGGQLRYLMYDSLSRLIRAKNPEQGYFTPDPAGGDFPALSDTSTGSPGNSNWSLGYLYDANGNLLKRKDARNVKTTYAYDGLNRNTTITYADETGTPTPSVKRTYDGATLGKGRPHHSYSGGDETTGTTVQDTVIDAYDAAGRPLTQRQRFKTGGVWGTASYPVGQEYTLAGLVKKVTYPSGHVVKNTYDNAGRLSGLTGNLGDGAQRTYATGIAYDASGRMTREQFGTQTALYNKRFYNVAGQLTQVRLGTFHATDQGWWNRGAIINHYTTQQWAGDGSDNNENLKVQEVFVPNGETPLLDGWETYSQYYDYDALNRLDKVREERGGVTRWQQDYVYDRWGNRTIDADNTWVETTTPPLPPSPPINEKQFEVGDLAATNRLYAPGDLTLPEAQRRMRYDGAGNLVHDTHQEIPGDGGTREYDAENRMTMAHFLSGQPQQPYVNTYDADGRRVKRKAGAAAAVWQVYGMGGELLAEYADNASRLTPQKEYGYRSGELLVTAEAPTPLRTNVALAANGGSVTASSTYDSRFPATSLNNGDRKGLNWGAGGGWSDGTANAYPDWVVVSFVGAKTIDEISVFTLQDNFSGPVEPTEALTFAQYGVTAFEAQYWTGTTWATVPGGGVTGNDKVWRKFTFAPVTTTKIRVLATGTADGNSRLTEVEAWAVPRTKPRVNHALATNGGSVTASSTYDSRFPAAGVNDGDRRGLNWAAGGGWSDATANSYPDWLEVSFNGRKSVSEVDVFTVQDNFAAPAEPTEAMTFSLYGVTSFEVEVWDGAAWAPIQGGVVSGNNSVWRKVTFPAAVVTEKIRVQLTGALDRYSRVTELEAWGPAAGGGASEVRWLVSDHLGTPRMVADETGSLAGVSRHDYLPFGEELRAGAGGRTTNQGYSQPDGVRQGFTGYEKDGETGLSFAQARYYAPVMGRFTSYDPLLASGRKEQPQSWNRYTYCINNPLMYTDPSGLDWVGRNVRTPHGLRSEYGWYTGKELQEKLDSKEGWWLVPMGADGTYVMDLLDSSGAWSGHQYYLKSNGEHGFGRTSEWGASAPWIINAPLPGNISHEGWGQVKLGLTLSGINSLSESRSNLPPGDIVLGFRQPALSLANQTRGAFYLNWRKLGLTSEDVTGNFSGAFSQASSRANRIHFALDGILDGRGVDFALERGSRGFFYGNRNYTNTELFKIYQNPNLFNKTQFYFEGRPVSPLVRPNR